MIRHARPGSVAAALALGVPLLVLLAAQVGTAEERTFSFLTALRGIGAELGMCAPLAGTAQVIVAGRLVDALVALFVGAALAYSGSLLQGVFRNGLASPGLIGVTAGASLGATVGILLIGGAALDAQVMQIAARNGPLVLTGLAFAGALVVALLVTSLASRGGRVSVPTLLLVGVALNACLGGALAAIQDVLLRERWQLAQALFSWLFGSLSERTLAQVGIVATGLALALVVLPFVARELDLLAGGEEDAEALGVDTRRTKLLALGAASLAAASAVAVAGQIAFVGLVVPHVLRIVIGASHRALLPLSLLGGGVFLLGAEVANEALLGARAMRPGVVLSLIGGPFFLMLLLQRRSEVRTW